MAPVAIVFVSRPSRPSKPSILPILLLSLVAVLVALFGVAVLAAITEAVQIGNLNKELASVKKDRDALRIEQGHLKEMSDAQSYAIANDFVSNPYDIGPGDYTPAKVLAEDEESLKSLRPNDMVRLYGGACVRFQSYERLDGKPGYLVHFSFHPLEAGAAFWESYDLTFIGHRIDEVMVGC